MHKPNSIRHITGNPFPDCGTLRVIKIEALNEQEHERINALIPQELRRLVIPYELCQEIKSAHRQAFLSLKNAIGIDYFPVKLPEAIINIIQQMNGSLHALINHVTLPCQPQELEQKACAIPFLLEAGQATPRPLAEIFFD